MHCGTETKSEASPWPRKTFPTSHVTRESRSRWLLGRCSQQLHKSCASEGTVCSQPKRVFTLEHHSASEPYPAVHEAFSNAYTDKKYWTRQQHTDW
jgi:hypothetical protein